MYRNLRFILLIVLGIFSQSSCGDKKPSNKLTDDKMIDSVDTYVETLPDEDSDVFERYEAVKNVLHEWNRLISNNETQPLHALYANEVMCYLEILNKESCVSKKAAWLNAHAGYKQELEHI